MTDHISRSRRPRRLFVAATAVVVTATSTAAAQTTAGPDLSRMVVAAADLPAGTQVVGEGYARGSHRTIYERTLDVGGLRQGHLNGGIVDDTIELEDYAAKARADVRVLEGEFASPSGHRALARSIANAAGGHRRVAAKDVRFEPVRSLPVGDRAFDLRLSVRTRAGRVRSDIAIVAVDRGLGMLVVTSGPRSPLVQRTVPMLRTMAVHMREGLSPQSTSPPLVTGTPAVGQPLAASAGTWDAATPPTGFAYQWLRCDAAGNACVPISGATQQSYTPTPADASTTLRVSVTATNDAGTALAASAPVPIAA